MNAFVDPELCIGCTQCAGLCPAVFRMEGVLAVAEPGPIPPEEVPQAVTAAQSSHNFIYRGQDVTTDGNPLAHVILRGGVDKYGTCIPNYHYEDLMHLSALYAKKDLKNPAIIIDANHSNSNKQYKEQIRIVSEVLHSRNYNPELKKLVKGVMIESYLLEGRQDISDHMTPGCSITDPCLGWEDTERLIYDIAEKC